MAVDSAGNALTFNPTTTVSLNNTVTGKSIVLETPSGTSITCDSSVTEASLAKQDTGYTYPLGLVNLCYDTSNTSDLVTLIFVTSLTPSQVVARDFNSSSQTYSDISGASVTQTTYNGQAALELTYTVADNGSLDTNATTGIVNDPVGLAVAVTSTAAVTPDTGYGQPIDKNLLPIYGLIAAGLSLTGGIYLLHKRIRHSVTH